MTDETRIVNPVTGGAKGQKLARFDLIPADALRQIAEHYGKGAEKYEDRNWERGYDWSLSFGALNRHLWAFWGGEDYDVETGSHHLAAVAFHTLALLTFANTHTEMDDRPTEDIVVDVGPVSPDYFQEQQEAALRNRYVYAAWFDDRWTALSAGSIYDESLGRDPIDQRIIRKHNLRERNRAAWAPHIDRHPVA